MVDPIFIKDKPVVIAVILCGKMDASSQIADKVMTLD